MKLLNVNIGKSQSIQYADRAKPELTGIYKIATSAPVRITRDGVEGDAILDTANHGGDDQAIYAYGSADYAWWSGELGVELEPGTFGENFTISDLEMSDLQIGDRLHIGDSVVIELTAPRIPCVTLATRMGDPTFVKRFRQAERPGLYCRVIEAGIVCAGDSVTLEKTSVSTVTAREIYRAYYDQSTDEAVIRRILAAPIAIRARQDYEERLAKLLSTATQD